MEMNPSLRYRRRGLLALTIALSVITALLGVLLWMILESADHANADLKPAIFRLAWITLATLALTLLLLLWVAIRYLVLRTRPQAHEPTEYVDAWSLAGQRFELANGRIPIENREDEDDELDDEIDDDDFDEEDEENEEDDDSGEKPR